MLAKTRVRTLLRMDKYFPHLGLASFIAVGWNPRQPFYISLAKIPPEVTKRLNAGNIRFHAEVNLNAASVNELLPDKWEVF